MIKRIIKKIFNALVDDVNWEEVSTLNLDHVTAKKVSKMLNISERFADTILRTSVRRGEAVPCCSYYDSEREASGSEAATFRHRDCYRFITGGKIFVKGDKGNGK